VKVLGYRAILADWQHWHSNTGMSVAPKASVHTFLHKLVITLAIGLGYLLFSKHNPIGFFLPCKTPEEWINVIIHGAIKKIPSRPHTLIR